MAFVQQATSTSLVGSTIAATYGSAQTLGNLGILTFTWTAGATVTITSVVDSSGNSWTLGRKDTTAAQGLATYFAPNIAAAGAGSNTVTVTFTGSLTAQSLSILEYSAEGQDIQVVDVSGVASGSGATATTPSVATIFPFDLVYAAVSTLTGGVGVGSGYTLRTNPGRGGTEDKSVTTQGSFSASFSLTSGAWITHILCFRADSRSRDITPIGAPTDFVQVTWGGPSGGGNHDILLWYDNVYIANGTSADSTNSYDSFNGNDAGSRTTDWYGYTFPITLVFSGITFQQGGQFADGGWFTSTPNIQVLVAGVWTTVSGAVWSPSYAGNNGVNFFPYQATFTPMAGTGIRIQGVPGGSSTFTSIRQLRCYGPTLYQDPTALGTATSFVQTTWGGPTGAGGPISVMSDNVWPAASTTPTGSNEYDTLNSNDAGTRTTDWWGYTFGSSQTFVAVALAQGGEFGDGGWFTSTPNVQVLISGVWTTVAGASFLPSYAGNNGVSFFRYVVTFSPTAGTGIRIQGTPGGSNTFTSVGELRAYIPSTSLSTAPQDPIGFGAEA